jgi:hypothetical protein
MEASNKVSFTVIYVKEPIDVTENDFYDPYYIAGTHTGIYDVNERVSGHLVIVVSADSAPTSFKDMSFYGLDKSALPTYGELYEQKIKTIAILIA